MSLLTYINSFNHLLSLKKVEGFNLLSFIFPFWLNIFKYVKQLHDLKVKVILKDIFRVLFLPLPFHSFHFVRWSFLLISDLSSCFFFFFFPPHVSFYKNKQMGPEATASSGASGCARRCPWSWGRCWLRGRSIHDGLTSGCAWPLGTCTCPCGICLGYDLDRKNDEKLTAFWNKSLLYKRELKPNEEVTWK